MRRGLLRCTCAGVAPMVFALLVVSPVSFGWGENAEKEESLRASVWLRQVPPVGMDPT